MATVIAYCWANGVIEVCQACPDGALHLVKGHASKVRNALEILATHSYDGTTLIVPKSIAWCEGDMDAAVDDVLLFSERIRKFLERRVQ